MATRSEILTIDLASPTPGPGVAFGDSQQIMSRLRANGFEEIDLLGLSRYRARLRDGGIWDLMVLRVDDDAMFLVEAYQALQRKLREQASWKHLVYLNDGCFEINAHYLPNGIVRMRIGEYRESQFSPESDEGVSLSLAEYVSMWNTIAGLLARSAQVA
ncbi:hypothetical protein [Nannocystis radixulma]|uniref:Uncharacterized protein n=1 Tax=Nannocystis radixulma TaxID=2995305 RepID=A0ABT5B8M2_9BACT|nr:hypothetical protein [Nannocystis radixulma]MDC0670471.1 hypothetical protein [Nannocystis radixulma]